MTPLPSLSPRSTDQREYRRGMVLGLTMAEIAILLIFLLMLAAAAASMRRGEQSDADARALRERVELAEADARLQRERAERAERQRDAALQAAGNAAALVRRLDELVEANRSLAAQRDALRTERDRLAAALDARSRAESGGLAGVLRDMRERLGIAQDVPDARVLSALVRRLDELVEAERAASRQLAVLGGQNEQMRRELAQRRGQGGSGLPYCWPTSSGDTEFMQRISMHDGARVTVRDRLPMAQPSDPAWRLLVGVPRDRMMSMQEFRAAAEPLLAHARALRCRFAVEAIDMTGPSNKEGYKSLQRGIWELGFFQREVVR